MNKVLVYSAIAGLSLFTGSYLGIAFNFRQKVIAGFMAFGSGVLICALTFGLMDEAFKLGGFDAVIFGFITGGLVYVLGDLIIHNTGGRKHKKNKHAIFEADSNGTAITFGAFLDGIPESIALGVAIFAGKELGLLMLVAIALSNFPEGISSVRGLLKEGYRKVQILVIWFLAAIFTVLVACSSYLLLHDLTGNELGALQSFAAGAILAMLADTMMPEAYEEGGFLIGILTVLGFMVAFIIQKI
jgi:ZIP family zinc transporter